MVAEVFHARTAGSVCSITSAGVLLPPTTSTVEKPPMTVTVFPVCRSWALARPTFRSAVFVQVLLVGIQQRSDPRFREETVDH